MLSDGNNVPIKCYNTAVPFEDSKAVSFDGTMTTSRTYDSDLAGLGNASRTSDHIQWTPDFFPLELPNESIDHMVTTRQQVEITRNICDNFRPSASFINTYSSVNEKNGSEKSHSTYHNEQNSSNALYGPPGDIQKWSVYCQNTTDSVKNKCPNVTVSPWSWERMEKEQTIQNALSYPCHTNSNGANGEQQCAQICHEIRNRISAEEHIPLQVSPTSERFCTDIWPTGEPNIVQMSSIAEDYPISYEPWAVHASQVSTQRTYKANETQKYHNETCIPTPGSSVLTNSTNDISISSSSSVQYRQLTFPSSQSWYHSLGLLSAFTQILAPSQSKNYIQADKETTTRQLQNDVTSTVSDEPDLTTFSPISYVNETVYKPVSDGSSETNIWRGSTTIEYNTSPEIDSTEYTGAHCSKCEIPSNLSESTLDELRQFACRFKQRRMKLGVTQAEVGRALGRMQLGDFGCLSQSTICRFESLTLSHNNMLVLKPILEAWLEQMENQARSSPNMGGGPMLGLNTELDIETERRRRRTSITEPEKRVLEAYFQVEPKPTSDELSRIANGIRLKKSVVRVWFCNQRQKQKRLQMKQHLSRVTQFNDPISTTWSTMDPGVQFYAD